MSEVHDFGVAPVTCHSFDKDRNGNYLNNFIPNNS